MLTIPRVLGPNALMPVFNQYALYFFLIFFSLIPGLGESFGCDDHTLTPLRAHALSMSGIALGGIEHYGDVHVEWDRIQGGVQWSAVNFPPPRNTRDFSFKTCIHKGSAEDRAGFGRYLRRPR